MADISLRVIRLPRELPPLLARRFASLHVEAIRSIFRKLFLIAPQLVRTTKSWADELQNPLAIYWVLIAPNLETGQVSLEEGQWVGLYFIRGPLALQDYLTSAASNHQNGFAADETYWRAGRLYVKEAHRSMSALSLLYDTSVAFLEHESSRVLKSDRATENPTRAVRARVEAWVESAGVLYEADPSKWGRLVVELTFSQALDGAGFRDNIPEDFFEEEDFSKPVYSLYELVYETPT